MNPPHRRLVVNADDFGRSAGINAAVVRAHCEGILTSASLMVNEPACDEAVALAREHPKLGVGLHLSLLCGRAALPVQEISGLVNECGQFSARPFAVGCRYFFCRSLREQLRAEIHAQFDRFAATGLPLDHVNGHLHLHLHPIVLGLLMEDAARLGIRSMRLTREPFWMDAPLAQGRRLYRASHAAVYSCLAWRAQSRLRARSIHHTHRVFGLLQTGLVNEAYLTRLLSILPPGDSEVYSHPSLDESRHELDALLSPQVKALVALQRIQLIRYGDL